ncbi:MAG: energy-coupling factor ABC transporter ATP-binding protein [Treponema sp.]|nr:energy-coupling factor ABC transporter ATP-binding protein [Treponema sp.]
MALIELFNVSFEYDDVPALKDINLSIYEGECIGIEGDNGCGKTTLIRLLNGLIFATKGKYTFENQEVTEKAMKDDVFAKKLHQKMGYVFQNPETQLFCSSVKEEIAYGPRQMGLSEEEIETRCKDVMELLGLTALENRAPYHLSGGEKKKTALGCVLSMNPEILVLDEPLNGLDRKARETLMEFLHGWKQAGKTLIISTHDENLLNLITDRRITFGEDHSLI